MVPCLATVRLLWKSLEPIGGNVLQAINTEHNRKTANINIRFSIPQNFMGVRSPDDPRNAWHAKYSCLPITRPSLTGTSRSLELNSRFALDFLHTFTVILPPITRTLDNSNFPLTRSNFCFPSDHFYKILPSIYNSNHVLSASKVGKNSVLVSEKWILKSHWRGITNLTWNSFTSQTSKTHDLFRLCFVTLRSDL